MTLGCPIDVRAAPTPSGISRSGSMSILFLLGNIYLFNFLTL
jgi:hypothetical protein